MHIYSFSIHSFIGLYSLNCTNNYVNMVYVASDAIKKFLEKMSCPSTVHSSVLRAPSKNKCEKFCGTEEILSLFLQVFDKNKRRKLRCFNEKA
ncbi:hypothetical protein C0674_15125 [Sporolactobacillus terrae]|uniref:Uncharacterized protein n=1 Tax=Sporolactobacillus terrae TaxID=269673 RepID=A0ABX5QB15_9BACL|nr:hypothetical protein C0674_15125 [Sporolactobacillus terrae]QAA26783.1 hypothetical protein C0679_15110 [Sporolactobacillus terrae]